MTPYLLLALAAASGQITPVQPLPRGNPSPPPITVSEESQVMVPVNGIFAAIAARDGQMAVQYLRAQGGATIANEAADGSSKIVYRTWPEFVAGLKAGPERYQERLYDPAIEIDGNIAYVWGRYTFEIDGNIHHCGYDHFDLVREEGRWKIANITWSSRTTGCEE